MRDGRSEAEGLDATAVLTIDLGAIRANYALLRRRSGAAECAAVVKADAYGLGVERVAPALWDEGCRCFFVATLDEGRTLRRVLPEAGIYVFYGPLPADAAVYARHRLRPVLNSLEQIETWRRLDGADRPPAALQVDTGMARLGLGPDEVAALAAEPARLEGVAIDLVLSHLACADEPGAPLNARQLAAFRAALDRLGPLLERGGPPRASLAASSGIFLGPDFAFGLTRAGAALYGLSPIADGPNPMRQAVRLEARLLQVRHVDAGQTVGYGATHRLARPARLAVAAAGYADGYFRSLGNRGCAYIGDQRVPVVGRVSMDLVTLDVTEVAPELARPGAWVELIGPHHDADALARQAGTIGYEVLTNLGRRYRRRYLDAPA
ncbi:MAG: alanine racemase [Rhodospirillaceae bacterium]|nr:alanine racemase [Rhodospirillaceae bacterium]